MQSACTLRFLNCKLNIIGLRKVTGSFFSHFVFIWHFEFFIPLKSNTMLVSVAFRFWNCRSIILQKVYVIFRNNRRENQTIFKCNTLLLGFSVGRLASSRRFLSHVELWRKLSFWPKISMKNYVLIIEQYINYKSQVIYIILQSNRIYHLTNYLVSVIMLLLQYIAFWAIILCSSQFLVESKFFDKTRNPTQCQGKKGKRIFYLIYETNILNDNCFILIFDDTYILA